MNTNELIDLIDFHPEGNVSAALANRLGELIRKKEIPSNFLFPGECILCERLGISRSTLREAYKSLESSGYINRSRRGTIVNPKSQIEQAMPFRTIVESSDYNDLMEFRTIFEAEIANLAAQRASKENIEQLEMLLSLMKSSTQNLDRLTHYDMLFHTELAKATQNKLLRTTMEMSSLSFLDGIYKSFMMDTENNIRKAIKSHEQILTAIKCRDSEAAVKEMRKHIKNIHNLVK